MDTTNTAGMIEDLKCRLTVAWGAVFDTAPMLTAEEQIAAEDLWLEVEDAVSRPWARLHGRSWAVGFIQRNGEVYEAIGLLNTRNAVMMMVVSEAHTRAANVLDELDAEEVE
jgi:hypothetical protein